MGTDGTRPYWLDARGWLEKLALTAGALAMAIPGYYIIGTTTDPSAARVAANTARVATAFDRSVPFTDLWQFVYAAVYTSMVLPWFVVHDRRLFRRVAFAYYAVVVVTLVLYVAFPVSAKGYRPEIATLDQSTLWGWGVALNYHLDPPTNCFPSLHLGAAVSAGLAAWRSDKVAGVFGLVLAFLIGISTLFVKQHYVIDIVAGSLIAAAAYAAIVRPHPRGDVPAAETRAARQGIFVYAAFYGSVIAFLATLRALGYAPWRT